MAEVVLASASEKQVWVTKFMQEYVRESGLKPYMSTSSDAIIRIQTPEIQGQGAAYVNFPLVTRLKGRGVRGAEVLKGNEDDLGNYNDQVYATWIRNAVKVPKSTSYRTEINLLDAGKSALRTWDAEVLRDDVLDAMGSVIIPALPMPTALPAPTARSSTRWRRRRSATPSSPTMRIASCSATRSRTGRRTCSRPRWPTSIRPTTS
jgi:hypothetical protein